MNIWLRKGNKQKGNKMITKKERREIQEYLYIQNYSTSCGYDMQPYYQPKRQRVINKWRNYAQNN